MNKRKIILISASILAICWVIASINNSTKSINYESLNGFDELIDLREADESNFVEANKNMLNVLEQIWRKHGYYAVTHSGAKFSTDKKKADVTESAGNQISNISFIYSYDNLTSYMYEDIGRSNLGIFIENVRCDENFTFEDDVIKDSVNIFTGLTNKELQEAEEVIDLEKISEIFNTSYCSHGKENIVLHTWRKGIEIKGTIETSYNSRKEEWVHELKLYFSIRSYSNKK